MQKLNVVFQQHLDAFLNGLSLDGGLFKYERADITAPTGGEAQ